MAGRTTDRPGQGAILDPRSIATLKESGATVESVWTPNEMQVRMLQRTEFEILVAGGKAGGKSHGAIFWMVKGNPDKPDYDEDGKPILVNMSYTHHPRFLGAVIRLNEKDLADWVDQARPFYEGVLGGTYTKNPAEFRWPSGARIFLGHAQDSNAWTKYAGQNITRFFIDEAGQIRDMQTYDIIRSCCRSLVPDLRAQILLTANPDGPGMQWLFDRFIEPRTADGVPIKHPIYDRPINDADGGLIELIETGENPFTHEKVTRNRVWVPSYITDNPHAMASTDYIATLATMQDPKMRRAYLLGDWKALRGTYFDNFRRETHTYDPLRRPRANWWRVTASLDWGFVHESAAYWHQQDPETKQNLVYKEFVTNRTDPVELGAELARQSMPELRVQGSLTFHVSHDLYHERIGEFTWVELIAKGVQRVLGEGTCYIPEVLMKRLRDSYQMEGKEWDESIEDRVLNKEISGIVFRRAPKARAVGFMYMRSLMRMEPLISAVDAKPDWDIALRLSQEGSIADYATYLNSFKREVEILPQLLISQACPRLIEAIPKAIHSAEDVLDVDKMHFLGQDSLDSCRYLLAGIRDSKPTAMPRQLERERQLSEARRRNPELTTADMIWIARGIEDREAAEDGNADGFCLGRGARGARYRSVEDVM